VEERSHRLAQYEIILTGSGEISWKAHGGFAAAKSGKCFVQGDVLFLGPGEIEEAGLLKNEFLEYLRQLPQWESTQYYSPSCTLYACKGRRVQDGTERKTRRAANGHHKRENSGITPTDKKALIPVSPIHQIGRLKGKLGEAFRRCMQLVS
jgi:hypothetical protein